MTLDQFFIELKKLKDQGWSINGLDAIRNKEGYCPICAVAKNNGFSVSRTNFQRASELFKMREDISYWIASAADGESDYNKGYRKRIIEVLGL